MPQYHLQDVVNSYRWLGHQGAFTELNAIPSKAEKYEGSEKGRLAHIWYARGAGDVVEFLRKYHEHHMVCYGINPRPQILRIPGSNRPRSARDSEIRASQNLVLDFDLVSDYQSADALAALDGLLTRANEYFLDLRLSPPVRAFTGRGYHLLFACPAIAVSDCPDIGAKQKRFCEDFRGVFGRELASVNAKLDSTQDLRRMVKVYGTAKPDIGIISKFYGSERLEDERLAAYLLGLEPRQERNIALRTSAELPPWFETVLQRDARTRELWSGAGKLAGDTSRSGYDYSLVLRLMHLGYTDLHDLATVLTLRPEGSVQKGGKGDSYIRHTIANAILRPPAPRIGGQAG